MINLTKFWKNRETYRPVHVISEKRTGLGNGLGYIRKTPHTGHRPLANAMATLSTYETFPGHPVWGAKVSLYPALGLVSYRHT